MLNEILPIVRNLLSRNYVFGKRDKGYHNHPTKENCQKEFLGSRLGMQNQDINTDGEHGTFIRE